MRLLQLMAGAHTGGAENFFTRLAVALQADGLDQRLVIRADSEREAALRDAGIEVATAPFGGRLDFRTRTFVRREIRAWSPDIVLSWMNRATRHCPRPARRQRFVHIGSPRGYYHFKYYRNCDHLIVTTEDLVRFYIERGWDEDRITAIPNFAPDNRAAPVPRAEFGTPEDAPVLLALGRLHENKAFDVLIDAMTDLPGHFLWLGGDGPLDAALRARAGQLGVADRVRFLGWVDDPAPLFAAADIFVCSSRHEPFGNIVIEAWLSETPIVAAASQGPGALIADGEDGLLVPVDDASALVAAIARLAADPALRRRLSAAGRARYEADFNQGAVLARYRALFERLLA